MAVFLWIFLQICSVNEERMDDDFKPVLMIANLHYLFIANSDDKSFILPLDFMIVNNKAGYSS